MKQKTTEFAQVKIEKVGIKYVTAELTGSLKNYTAKLIKNSVIADVKTGDTIFLRVQDQSEISNHGTKLKFEPLELLTDPIVIEKYILADRKRVTEIYIKAANDNLDKGWYSGDAISNALIMISSQPSYKISNLEIRHKRLANIISACNAYKFRQTEKFLALCNEV